MYFLFVCRDVDMHMVKNACSGQKNLAKSLVSPSIMWVTVNKFMSGIGDKYIYLLNHLLGCLNIIYNRKLLVQTHQHCFC